MLLLLLFVSLICSIITYSRGLKSCHKTFFISTWRYFPQFLHKVACLLLIQNNKSTHSKNQKSQGKIFSLPSKRSCLHHFEQRTWAVEFLLSATYIIRRCSLVEDSNRWQATNSWLAYLLFQLCWARLGRTRHYIYEWILKYLPTLKRGPDKQLDILIFMYLLTPQRATEKRLHNLNQNFRTTKNSVCLGFNSYYIS